ncbi:hypothetical protein [Collinsella ihumii]|uniref:DUF5105 domain-containing protein n=1 Tax=Collinsella ihumii TaxID=1720204 RepID=A0AAW7JRC6_9ACTN|nr:hypothetical protein [Collinsella ihumii]MBM6777149.1 hypothetical protein [Collinsella tanakaei]MDN0070138.1 hypothetical protein [Collinsella ihumii]
MRMNRPVAHAAGIGALACALALGGCGLFGPSPEQIVRDGLASDFDMLLDEESQARQTMVSNLESTGALSGLGVDTQGFLNALFEGMEYEIASVEVDDEAKTATATVELTCKSLTDVATRAQELLNQRAADAGETAISPEETLAWMGECLMQAAREDAPESVELELDCSSDDEGTWSADDSVAAAVAGALLG